MSLIGTVYVPTPSSVHCVRCTRNTKYLLYQKSHLLCKSLLHMSQNFTIYEIHCEHVTADVTVDEVEGGVFQYRVKQEWKYPKHKTRILLQVL